MQVADLLLEVIRIHGNPDIVLLYSAGKFVRIDARLKIGWRDIALIYFTPIPALHISN